jgi:hypothetical protein
MSLAELDSCVKSAHLYAITRSLTAVIAVDDTVI